MKKIILLFPVLLAACSSQGFHQAELRSAAAVPRQVSAEIAQVMKQRPQLPKPFRIGIYFREPELRGADGGAWNRWTKEEKDKVFATIKEVSAGEVSAVFPILGAPGNDLASIRVAAARQGADAVMVVSGASETVASPNPLAFGYILVAPLFFLHGTDVETLFYARAALWDVRNEYLYLGAEGEATVKAARPFAYQDHRSQLERAKELSLENLCVSLNAELREALQAKN